VVVPAAMVPVAVGAGSEGPGVWAGVAGAWDVASSLGVPDVKNMVGIDRRRSRRLCHNHEPLRGSLLKPGAQQ
jgi:hypothetical protein